MAVQIVHTPKHWDKFLRVTDFPWFFVEATSFPTSFVWE